MNPIPAKRATDLVDRAFDEKDSAGHLIEKGEFRITTDEATSQRWFWFKCPGACGVTAAVALRPVVAPGTHQSWELSGTEDAPTLQPSINHVGCWHGWLRNGVFSLA